VIVVVAASALVARSSLKYLNKEFATCRYHFPAQIFSLSNLTILKLTNVPLVL